MARKFFYICAGMLMLAGATTGGAQTIVPWGDGGYRYCFCEAPVSQTSPSYDDSGMPVTAAPFTVNINGCNYAEYGPHTTWNQIQPLFVRKSFTLPGAVSDVRLHLAASPILDIYINGHWLCHMVQQGCGTREGLVVALPDFFLQSGTNVIAIQAYGNGGGIFSAPVLDMAVTASGAVPSNRSTWSEVKARYR